VTSGGATAPAPGDSDLSEILSQTEIEKLLAELQGGQAEGGVEPGSTPVSSVSAPAPGIPVPTSSRTVTYEVYDFRRPDKFAKDQLRTLQMVHETFARLASSGLSAYLRCPVQVELISLEQVPYEEYLLSINKSVFTIISLPPLNGQAVIEIEFSLVFAILDRMLGGTGRAFDRSSLTDIERPLVTQVLERLFSALKTSWETIVMVSPSVEGMETSPQFVQVAPRNDIVVTVLLEVKVGSQRGAMSLCIPYLVLKPITSKLGAQTWYYSGERKATSTTRNMLSYHVGRVPVVCTVELGTASINVGEFLELKPGDIVKLSEETTADMLLKVGDLAKFYGRPAVSGRKIVFTISGRVPE
jgi:flagellar motor switch protein FliM